MKFKTAIAAALALALSIGQAFAQATILPPGETCFQATTGINGMVGVLGTITGGNSYSNGSYGGVALTGGSGTGATANITVSGGIVTQVTVLNPGIAYVVGDVLSAAAANIGGSGSGFSVPVSSTSINSSLAGGTAGFYIPNTQAFKQTWTDSGQTTLNQNPVPLDQNGCAVVYGAGIYRQILKDSLGNTVWDKLTASTSPQGIFWAGLAGGTGNVITITDSSFALQDGATIQFLAAATNTGPTTINVSGGGAISVVKDTSTGPAALSGGEFGPGNTPLVTYDATNVEFHLVNPASTSQSNATSSLAPPQGYLNLVGQASGDVVQVGDVIGTSTVYYSPFVGNQIPVWNGSAFVNLIFSELTATLTSAGSPAGGIQDQCVFSNNGVPTLVTGPAWTSPTPGAGNRGTGAGSAQITRLNGVWVNANQIIAYNGLSSFTVATNRCTYVGSISIDGTAGQVSAYRNYGQLRKFGVWNAYNRLPIVLQAGDTTPPGSWSYTTGVIRAANGNPDNSLQLFQGLPEEQCFTSYTITIAAQSLAPNQSNGGAIGIGVNSAISFAGTFSTGTLTNVTASPIVYGFKLPPAMYTLPPFIGIQTVTAVEEGLSTTFGTWIGGQASMLLTGSWRG